MDGFLDGFLPVGSSREWASEKEDCEPEPLGAGRRAVRRDGVACLAVMMLVVSVLVLPILMKAMGGGREMWVLLERQAPLPTVTRVLIDYHIVFQGAIIAITAVWILAMQRLHRVALLGVSVVVLLQIALLAFAMFAVVAPHFAMTYGPGAFGIDRYDGGTGEELGTGNVWGEPDLTQSVAP
jgi:hypothetical protein